MSSDQSYTHIHIPKGSSSSPYGPLLLTTVINKQLVKGYELSGPLSFQSQLELAARNIELLQNKHAMDVLYATYELGVVWKGRLHKHIDATKSTLYPLIEALWNAGWLEGMSKQHTEVKSTLHLMKIREPRFHIKSVGDCLTISEQYLDIVTEIFSDGPQGVGNSTIKAVNRSVKGLVHLRQQQSKMREAQKQTELRKYKSLAQRAGWISSRYNRPTPLSQYEQKQLKEYKDKYGTEILANIDLQEEMR